MLWNFSEEGRFTWTPWRCLPVMSSSVNVNLLYWPDSGFPNGKVAAINYWFMIFCKVFILLLCSIKIQTRVTKWLLTVVWDGELIETPHLDSQHIKTIPLMLSKEKLKCSIGSFAISCAKFKHMLKSLYISYLFYFIPLEMRSI